MVQHARFLAAIAAAIGAVSSGVSAVTTGPIETTTQGNSNNASLAATSSGAPTGNASEGIFTVENTCVLANFQTATADFTALDNIVEMIKTTPTLLQEYMGDPVRIRNYTLATLNMSFLGHIFDVTPRINSMDVAGITTMVPMRVNVTSSNTLDLGMDFSGTIALRGSLTLKVTQRDHRWYQICWVNILHSIRCQPRIINVKMKVTVRKPQFIAHVRANLYQCASGISTSVCKNLTMTDIMTDAMQRNFTGVSAAIFKNFKNAKINTLALNWDTISDVSFTFDSTSEFVKKISDSMLRFSANRLNVKGYYHRVFRDVAQSFLLWLMNKIIDTTFQPLFGATCL